MKEKPNFKWIKSDKFSNINICITFVKKADISDLKSYSLLPQVLNIGTVNYPTKKEMNLKTCSLYNATVGWSASRSYDALEYSFTIDCINPKNVSNSKEYLDEVFDFAYECMFNPLLNDTKTAFNEKNFVEKKKRAINVIKNIRSNKDSYAYVRFLEEFRRVDEGEYPLGRSRDYTDLVSLTNEHLYELYKDFLYNSEVIISGIGDMEESEIAPYIDKFGLFSEKIKVDTCSHRLYSVRDVKEVVEYDNLDQAKLFMGFRTDINLFDEVCPSAVLFTIMFGGLYNSTLTNVVRTKLSLCYDISISYSSGKQYAIVSCGTFNDKALEVKDIVINELEKYNKGEIENAEELFSIVKESVMNEYRQFYDSSYNYVYEAIRVMSKRYIEREKWFKALMDTTLEDIIEASKLFRLDTVYVLRGRDNE